LVIFGDLKIFVFFLALLSKQGICDSIFGFDFFFKLQNGENSPQKKSPGRRAPLEERAAKILNYGAGKY
jgi:hypothetical protein